MFNVCYNCDGKLIEYNGNIKGYWDDKEVEFIGLPSYKCESCDEIYLDEEIAILTQEITRAFYDIEHIPKVVDISNCHELLVEHLDKVYDIIAKKKFKAFNSNDKVVIGKKDLISLFNDCDILFAARNISATKDGLMTQDMYDEIDKLL